MINKSFNRTSFWLWLLTSVLLNIIVHHRWFLSSDPLAAGDTVFMLADRFKELIIPYAWQNVYNFGAFNCCASFYPFSLVGGIVARLGLSTGVIERIIFFWPIAIFGSLFSYLLVYRITRHGFASFIGTLVFNFNTFFILSSSGHITLTTAYIFLPLVLLLYHMYLKTENKKLLLWISLSLFVVSFYEFRAFYILCFIIGFLYLFSLLKMKKRELLDFAKYSFWFFTPLLIVLLLNSYWLVYFFLGTSKEAIDEVMRSSLFIGGIGNSNLLLNSITLFHQMWSGKELIPFSIHPLPTQYYVIPLIAFSFLLFLRKKSLWIFFYATLSLFGIFLGKFIAPPFGALYEWMFERFPGFGAFREPSKFRVIIFLAYSVLIGYVISTLWKHHRNTIQSKVITYLITAAVFVLFIFNALPIFDGSLGTLFVTTPVPKDYQMLQKTLLSSHEYFRTLWFPMMNRWHFYTNLHPSISALHLLQTQWKKIPFVNNDVDVRNMFLKPNIQQLLDQASVRYVVIPLEDAKNEFGFEDYFKKTREEFIQQLDRVSFLQRVFDGQDGLVVYENKTYRPHLYATVPYIKVNYSFVDPVTYRVSVNNVSSPFDLNFSEYYDVGWKLRVGEIDWLKTLTQKDYFISDELHRPNAARMNSFYIDPQALCRQFECKQNENGSYNLVMNLYFKPQSYLYLGGIVSVATLIVLIGGTAFTLLGKKKETA